LTPSGRLRKERASPALEDEVKIIVAVAALLLASCSASSPPAIAIDDAWARATVPAQMSSAAYFTIRNSGGPDALVSISSPSANASLHSTSMDNGVMRMRPLASLDVPANATVELKPGGTHIMLMDLKAPLAAGSTIELDLRFEKSGERRVEAQVRPADGAAM
jgi:copper(I)-binding protein